jgi:hypothetical protein
MFTIDLTKMANDTKLLAVVRLLAVQLQRKPYIMPGEFLGAISDADLQSLSQVFEAARDENLDLPGHNDAAINVLALTGMLVIGEGGDLTDEAAVREYAGMSYLFVCLESLARKGAINLAREKLSFIDSDAVVASAKDVPLD